MNVRVLLSILLIGLLLAAPLMAQFPSGANAPIGVTGDYQVQSNYSVGRMNVQRLLLVHQIARIDPSTGAAVPQFESIVRLSVTNTGPLDLQNVSLMETLGYLPPYARLAFSPQPSSDGRSARWDIGPLSVGNTYSVWFSAPIAVPAQGFEQAGAPQLNWARQTAVLDVPTSVENGSNTILNLKTPDGQPMPGADILVNTPSGTTMTLQTDSLGRAVFLASATGYYTYEVPDYQVGFVQATESQVPVVVVPPTTEAITPVSAPTPQPGNDMLSSLWGLAPMAVGLLLVGAIALALFTYFNTGTSEENEPTPPAPATRPIIAEGRNPSSAGSLSGQPIGTASISTASSMGTPVRTAAKTDMTTASLAAEAAQEAQMREQTRDLLSHRRGASSSPANGAQSGITKIIPAAPARPSPPAYAPAENEEEELEADTLPQEKEEPPPHSPWQFTESTYVPPQEEGEVHFDEPQPEEHEPGLASRRAPEWMTRPEVNEGGGEMAEIDDEAIAKTIAELEQLRAELAARSSARGAPVRKMAAAQGRAEWPYATSEKEETAVNEPEIESESNIEEELQEPPSTLRPKPPRRAPTKSYSKQTARTSSNSKSKSASRSKPKPKSRMRR